MSDFFWWLLTLILMRVALWTVDASLDAAMVALRGQVTAVGDAVEALARRVAVLSSSLSTKGTEEAAEEGYPDVVYVVDFNIVTNISDVHELKDFERAFCQPPSDVCVLRIGDCVYVGLGPGTYNPLMPDEVQFVSTSRALTLRLTEPRFDEEVDDSPAEPTPEPVPE